MPPPAPQPPGSAQAPCVAARDAGAVAPYPRAWPSPHAARRRPGAAGASRHPARPRVVPAVGAAHRGFPPSAATCTIARTSDSTRPRRSTQTHHGSLLSRLCSHSHTRRHFARENTLRVRPACAPRAQTCVALGGWPLFALVCARSTHPFLSGGQLGEVGVRGNVHLLRDRHHECAHARGAERPRFRSRHAAAGGS